MQQANFERIFHLYEYLPVLAYDRCSFFQKGNWLLRSRRGTEYMRDHLVRTGRVELGLNERDIFFQCFSRPKYPHGLGEAGTHVEKVSLTSETIIQKTTSKKRETSVDCSDQAAVSGKHLHPLSIFIPGRPGFPPLDAVPLRAAFVRPETEIETGNQENPVQRCGCSRIIPREFFCFRWEHVKRVRPPRPRVVPFRQHPGVDLNGI